MQATNEAQIQQKRQQISGDDCEELIATDTIAMIIAPQYLHSNLSRFAIIVHLIPLNTPTASLMPIVSPIG